MYIVEDQLCRVTRSAAVLSDNNTARNWSYRAGRSGFQIPTGAREFSLSKRSREGMGSTQTPMEKVPRNLSQGESGLNIKLAPYPV
jgi:hypothetical protein